jgi:hypothetical protein
LTPDAGTNCYVQGGCNFTWSWNGKLASDDYFQVQVIGPNNEHRGIHPPTKGNSFKNSESTYWIFTDWCDPSEYCHIRWTVAIIKWDGKDPSKIGRTIIEADPREIVF